MTTLWHFGVSFLCMFCVVYCSHSAIWHFKLCGFLGWQNCPRAKLSPPPPRYCLIENVVSKYADLKNGNKPGCRVSVGARKDQVHRSLATIYICRPESVLCSAPKGSGVGVRGHVLE